MKNIYLTVITLLILITFTYGSNFFPPVVNLPLGKVEGTTAETFKNRSFYSFEGIPYARPPVGKHRFKEPVLVKPWKYTWKAKTVYKCMQYNQYTKPGEDFVVGDEDCLYLNIYTPNLNRNANLDVVVYIHGGAFMFNYGAFQGPQLIMDKNVVYVSLNYRLGPLGFLSTENELVPGNNGIKDQILALQWVQDYIEYFGGNPKSVTITGMSAGGASVHLHFLSPKSKGLFHSGISQSGTALNPWVLMEKPLEKTLKLASTVGCSSNDLSQTLYCLRQRPGRQIVHAVKEFQPWLYNPFSPFGVVVDSWSPDPVLPDHPYNLVKSGQVADLPWIASHTNSEGLYPAADFYADESYLADIDARWNELMPHILDYNYTVDPAVRDEVSQKIRKFYMGDKMVSRQTFMDFVQILSDRVFINDIRKAARLQASVNKSPVYSYYFCYRGKSSRCESRTGTSADFGAAHADDTSYVFRTYMDTLSTESDRLITDLMVELFATFAQKGKPQVLKDEWLPLSKKMTDPFCYLKIESPDTLAMELQGVSEAEKFWAGLPIKENERLFAVKDEL